MIVCHTPGPCHCEGKQAIAILWLVYTECIYYLRGFPGSTISKEPACQCRRCKRCEFDLYFGKYRWKGWEDGLEKGMVTQYGYPVTPVFLPEESHGQRSLAGYRPWSCKELDLTKIHRTFYSTQGSYGRKRSKVVSIY